MTHLSDLVRPEVLRLAPYNAGLTIQDVARRYAPARIAKLGSNESPLGPSPAASAAAERALKDMRLYPDPAARDLRDALARHVAVPSDRIMVGNGSEDLLAVIARATLRPGDRVVTLYPSFPLHEDYATVMGAQVERVPVRADLTIDPAALAAAARSCRMLIFSHPMNPVGSWLSGPGLAEVVAGAGPDVLIVVDEAYAEYAAGPDYPSAAALLEGSDRPWIVLRTFSKSYGLAALRVGYGIFSDAAICGLMDRVRTPFNVNGIAQAAAIAALGDEAHLGAVVSLAVQERDRMGDFLDRGGVRHAKSKGNFIFFDCGSDAGAFAEGLLKPGVIVKPWKQAGYQNFARVSIGSAEENSHFMEAATALLQSPSPRR